MGVFKASLSSSSGDRLTLSGFSAFRAALVIGGGVPLIGFRGFLDILTKLVKLSFFSKSIPC